MRVTALHLHPIKACGRVEVERATIGPYGLAGDREWQLVSGDQFVTQRTHPQLATLRPTLTDDGIVLDDLAVTRPAAVDTTAPTYTGDVPAADAGDEAAEWFTRFLGQPVRLVGIAPGYERSFPMLFGEQQMAFSDGASILVVSAASHRYLAERAKEPFGIERWRPNIVVDGGEPWAEDTWRALRVGEATVTLRHPWPRCAVPQVDQETGERHHEPAVVLKAHRWCAALPDAEPILQAVLCGNALFGVTASAEPIGAEIAVGDEVEVLTTSEALLRM